VGSGLCALAQGGAVRRWHSTAWVGGAYRPVGTRLQAPAEAACSPCIGNAPGAQLCVTSPACIFFFLHRMARAHATDSTGCVDLLPPSAKARRAGPGRYRKRRRIPTKGVEQRIILGHAGTRGSSMLTDCPRACMAHAADRCRRGVQDFVTSDLPTRGVCATFSTGPATCRSTRQPKHRWTAKGWHPQRSSCPAAWMALFGEGTARQAEGC